MDTVMDMVKQWRSEVNTIGETVGEWCRLGRFPPLSNLALTGEPIRAHVVFERITCEPQGANQQWAPLELQVFEVVASVVVVVVVAAAVAASAA